MIKLNNKMTKTILFTNEFNDEMVLEKVNILLEKIFCDIKLIDGCIIIDLNNEIRSEKLNHDWILLQYGDYTGYEVSCNEIRVSDYLQLHNVKSALFTIKLVEEFRNLLNKIYESYKFVVIGIIKDGDIEIRFHILRDNENGWLSENIDEYNEEIVISIG